MNKGQRLSFSFPDLWYSLLEINSRKICQHLTNWTSWNKRDKVWSSANSLFKGRFCSRRRREREGKKATAGGLDWQNNKFARASRFFVHFFALVATWKCLNLRFVEDIRNIRQQLSFSLPELWYSPLEFNSKKGFLTFDEVNEMEWAR